MITEFKKTCLIDFLEKNIDTKVERCMNKECSVEECNKYITDMLRRAFVNKVISEKNIIDLYRRADGRTLTQFWIKIKKNVAKEKKFCEDFIKVCEKKGEKVYFKNYGNEDKGRVRILNYKSKPDVLLGRNNKEIKMDVKEMNKQLFKINDLRVYIKKQNSGIIVNSDGCFWVYSPETVKIILEIAEKNRSKYVYKYKKWWNKEVIEMGDGKNKTVPLDILVKKGLVEKIRIE